jgi:hypothetical protein
LQDRRDRRLKLVILEESFTSVAFYTRKPGVLNDWQAMTLGKTVRYERRSAGDAEAQGAFLL